MSKKKKRPKTEPAPPPSVVPPPPRPVLFRPRSRPPQSEAPRSVATDQELVQWAKLVKDS